MRLSRALRTASSGAVLSRGESTSIVWPTLGSSTANRTEQNVPRPSTYQGSGLDLDHAGVLRPYTHYAVRCRGVVLKKKWRDA